MVFGVNQAPTSLISINSVGTYVGMVLLCDFYERKKSGCSYFVMGVLVAVSKIP